MSRVGKKLLQIPEGVTITVNPGNEVVVKGAKGELSYTFNEKLTIAIEDGTLSVTRPDESKTMRQLHGTTRALIGNMVEGVSKGYKKELLIEGVGYRANVQGETLNLAMGYSHPVDMEIEEGITVECPKNTHIVITGIDKQRVGEFAANVRAVRPPEPYKGKGIRYATERIRRKEGKKAA